MIQFAPQDIAKIRGNYPELLDFDYVFGRVMYETNSLPVHWDRYINDNTDEAWVPSHFERQVFEVSLVSKKDCIIVVGILSMSASVVNRSNPNLRVLL